RHPVSTSSSSRGLLMGMRRGLGGTVEAFVVGPSILPSAPQHAEPGTREDADGVGMIAAATASCAVDAGGPGGAVAGVVGPADDGLAQALVAGPAESDAAVFAGFVRHRRGTGLSGEVVGA